MTLNTRAWFHQWEVKGSRRSAWRRLTGPQLLAASFALLILLGTLGLKVLPGLYTGEELGWLDALFTATSAVCVTGLIVVDTATYFTVAGQAWLLLLIQLGGLGIITFTTLIIVALGRRLSLRHERLVDAAAQAAPHIDYQRLTRNVIVFTFALEAIGAVLLYLAWAPELGFTGSAWPALFHAISAFCNAGFSTFGDSLMRFDQAPVILGIVMTLIVFGGIGFLTIEELGMRLTAWRQGRRYRLSLHTRIVLAMTALLLLGGWALFSLFEWSVTLEGMPVWAKLTNALFMSVTARTAGFNTVDYSDMAARSDFLTIILMMIGGSPGSTAGGLKTTTVALIGLLAWSRFRGHEVTSLWGRSVPEETIQRAVGLLAVAFGLITAAIFAYTTTEMGMDAERLGQVEFLRHVFEAVSAFNTVGLSMGLTESLSNAGKCVTILLMFLGRVGPLTFAAAIALKKPTPEGEFRYSYEDVVVG